MSRRIARLGVTVAVAALTLTAGAPAAQAASTTTFTMKTTNSGATGSRTVSNGTHTITGKLTVTGDTACATLKLVNVTWKGWFPVPGPLPSQPVAGRCGAGSTVIDRQITPPAGLWWLSLCEPAGKGTSCAVVG